MMTIIKPSKKKMMSVSYSYVPSDPNRYKRRCPDHNARILKFIHYMATPQRGLDRVTIRNHLRGLAGWVGQIDGLNR